MILKLFLNIYFPPLIHKIRNTIPLLQMLFEIFNCFIKITDRWMERYSPQTHIHKMLSVCLNLRNISSKCTRVFRNTDNPYYEWLFIFVYFCSTIQMLRLKNVFSIPKYATKSLFAFINTQNIDLVFFNLHL